MNQKITAEQGDRLVDEARDAADELALTVGCLTENQLALLTGCFPKTLQVWRKEGKGPSWVRLGNEVFYPKAPLQRWLEQQAQEKAPRSVEVSL
jgi:hypothetical protein